jgi:hypothetical protein
MMWSGRASWRQEGVWSKGDYLMVAKKQRERDRKELGTRHNFKGMPPVTCFLLLGPTSSFQQFPKYCHKLGTKCLAHKPVGDFTFKL